MGGVGVEEHLWFSLSVKKPVKHHFEETKTVTDVCLVHRLPGCKLYSAVLLSFESHFCPQLEQKSMI